MPLADLGVVEVECGLLASFSSSSPLGPSSPLKYSGKMGASRRSIASSAALVAGLLYFPHLPAVGCPLPDAKSECMLKSEYMLFSYLSLFLMARKCTPRPRDDQHLLLKAK